MVQNDLDEIKELHDSYTKAYAEAPSERQAQELDFKLKDLKKLEDMYHSDLHELENT